MKSYLKYILLLILVALGIFLINILRDEGDLSRITERWFWIHKTNQKERYQILLAGDSRIYRGLSPGEFEKQIENADAFNLGYSSLGYNLKYLNFLEEKLDTTANPPVIILGISPHTLSERGYRAGAFIREKELRKKEEIIMYMHFFGLQKYFLPYDIKSIISGKYTRKKQRNYQVTFHPDGWVESYWKVRDTTFYIDNIGLSWKSNAYDEMNTEIFLRKVEEWTGRGIKVAAFRTPATKSVMAMEESISGISIEEFSKQLSEHGADWIDTDPSRYETYDGNHVDHRSAVLLSRDLAIAVRKLYFNH